MMTCREYVFRLTSGQLAESGPLARLQAFAHVSVCRHCRAFTRNDRRVTAIIRDYNNRLQQLPPGQGSDG